MNTFVGAQFKVGCKEVRVDGYVEKESLPEPRRVRIKIQIGKQRATVDLDHLGSIIEDMKHVLKKAREVQKTLPERRMIGLGGHIFVDNPLFNIPTPTVLDDPSL